jgi:hypothetical protein
MEALAVLTDHRNTTVKETTMAEQFIFRVLRGDVVRASCSSTDRNKALREAKDIAAEIGGDCSIIEKSPPSASLDRLYEQDRDPLSLS